ncbi:amino acid racemase [Candidatus Woesearchaeota archaeon]|nr:amino acid racemase [Candidatus Woesearchaeota archaeon]
MNKTLGIVGGLGTETSCSFCFNVNRQVKEISPHQPHIIMDNVPVPKDVERAIAHGEHSKEMGFLLKSSVRRLDKSGAHLIVIPCNTVHVFIDELRQQSTVPLLSIIEETTKECAKQGFQKVGLLASSTTVRQKLYNEKLRENGMELLTPDEQQQDFLSECIIKILNNRLEKEDRQKIIGILERLQERGAEAIILGCTDLFLAVKPEDVTLPLINSTAVLQNSVIEWLLRE